MSEAEFKTDEAERARLYIQAQAEEHERKRQSEVSALGFRETMQTLKQRAANELGVTVEEAERLGEQLLSEPDPQMSPARRMMLSAGGKRIERHIRNVGDRAPDECEALTAVREFLADDKLWCLVLAGGKGTRKTGSACWALSRVEGGAFFEAPDLLEIAINDKPFMARIVKAPLVVIDDLGTERQDDKGVWLGTFQDMWNKLYAAAAKVIVTGNLYPQDVYDKQDTKKLLWPGFTRIYGERVADRFREGGRWRVIGGESVRRKS